MGFDGEQRGEAWWARVRTPSLPICLTWLKNTLSTSWEISEMLCDVDKWLPLSGPWFPLIPEDISSPMKSALEFSTYPSAPLRGTLPTGRPHACKPPGPRPVTWLVGSGWGGAAENVVPPPQAPAVRCSVGGGPTVVQPVFKEHSESRFLDKIPCF